MLGLKYCEIKTKLKETKNRDLDQEDTSKQSLYTLVQSYIMKMKPVTCAVHFVPQLISCRNRYFDEYIVDLVP